MLYIANAVIEEKDSIRNVRFHLSDCVSLEHAQHEADKLRSTFSNIIDIVATTWSGKAGE